MDRYHNFRAAVIGAGHDVHQAWLRIWNPPIPEQRAPGSSKVLSKTSTDFVSPTVNITATVLGTQYLELFDQLNRYQEELQQVHEGLAHLQLQHSTLQSQNDRLHCDLRRAESETRADLMMYTETWSDTKMEGEAELDEVIGEQNELKTKALHLESEISGTWARIYRSAPRYIDFCLQENFSQAWCLTHAGCIGIRVALDQHNLVLERGKELIHLRKSQSESTLSSDHDRKLRRQDTRRRERRARLAETLRLSKVRLEEIEQACIKSYIQPLLRRNALSDNLSSRSRESSIDEAQPDLDLSTLSIERLQHRYMAARHELAVRQEHLADEEFRLREQEANHFLTFTNTSEERWDRMRSFTLAGPMGDVEIMEGICIQMRDDLERRGAQIPKSPSVDLGEKPVGGGLGDDVADSNSKSDRGASGLAKSRQSSEKRRAERLRMNDYRFGTGRSLADHGVRTPPSRQYTPEAMSVYSSPSGTPSSGRKRKLREFMETQRAMRDEFGERESDNRPRYRKDGLVETYRKRSRRIWDEDDSA